MLFQILADQSVRVEAKEPVVSIVLFDSQKPPSAVAANESAATVWGFKLETVFDFSLNTRENMGTDHAVNIRIDSAAIDLSLPITVYLPRDHLEKLKAHEFGHVAICRRVYKEAARGAGIAANKVVGRSYSGVGRTEKEACAAALAEADHDLSAYFRNHTTDVAESVSTTYDQLQAQEAAPPSVHVKDAFEIFEKSRSKAESRSQNVERI